MIKVAAIQMTSSDDVEANLADAAALIAKAAENGAKFIVLPENVCLMGMKENDKVGLKEVYGNGPLQTFFANKARENKIWLVAGTLPIAANDPTKIRSASILYDDQGRAVKRYDKIHLFDITLENGESYRESNVLEGGTELCVSETPAGKLGQAICYDVRFPAMFDLLRRQGAEVITLPSAFTYTTGKAHWRELVIATAIQQQVYVIAANQAGHHTNGRQTFGHTMIVDPWGVVLTEITTDKPGIAYAEIDQSRLKWVRKAIPILSHQRMIASWAAKNGQILSKL